jgi:hypothetical protein
MFNQGSIKSLSKISLQGYEKFSIFLDMIYLDKLHMFSLLPMLIYVYVCVCVCFCSRKYLTTRLLYPFTILEATLLSLLTYLWICQLLF